MNMATNIPTATDLEKMSEELAPLVAFWMTELASPVYQERMFAIATERMVKYQAHIKVGFTEAQALELCAL